MFSKSRGEHEAVGELGYEDNKKEFFVACEKASILPTKRQWRKWKRRIGKAWENRHEHLK